MPGHAGAEHRAFSGGTGTASAEQPFSPTDPRCPCCLCSLQLQLMRHQAEKEVRKHATGTFMRGTFGRSLAEGAHSLWKQAGEDASVSSGGTSTSGRSGTAPATASNRRRLGSARPGGSASAHSANARPGSAAVGGQRPASTGQLARGAAGSNALRASMPSMGKAAAPTAAPSHAAASSTSGRFASVPAAASSLGPPTRLGAARMDQRPPSPSPSGVKPRSRSSTTSAFAIAGNPWAPHILRFVQDRTNAALDRTELVMQVSLAVSDVCCCLPFSSAVFVRGVCVRGASATFMVCALPPQMLTAAPPEYIAADLTSLTERLVNLSSVRRQAEEEERQRQATAAAAAAAAAEAVAQAAAAASWGLTLPQLGPEASQVCGLLHCTCRPQCRSGACQWRPMRRQMCRCCLPWHATDALPTHTSTTLQVATTYLRRNKGMPSTHVCACGPLFPHAGVHQTVSSQHVYQSPCNAAQRHTPWQHDHPCLEPGLTPHRDRRCSSAHTSLRNAGGRADMGR